MFRVYLARKLHVSWHIAAASIMIFIGVVVARYIPPGIFYPSAWVLTGIAFILTGVWRGSGWAIVFSLCGGLVIGLWRGSAASADLSLYSQAYGATVDLHGVVNEDSDTNKRGQLVLRLKDISIDGASLKGSVWVTVRTSKHIQRSDEVSVSGKLDEGFGSFAASMYDGTLQSVKRPVPGDIALSVRDWFAEGTRHAIAEPEVSLGLGYLVGQRRGLPAELDTALRAAGLTHIVVASGYNLTILVRLARRLFEKVSKYLAFVASSGMILCFIAITGASPSMMRAGLVAGLSLLAWYYGRRFHPIVLLSLAIAITVLIQPSYAWGDLGWQLSFAAFAGVMIVAPIANAYFFGDKKEKPVGRILIETLSAQVCTLPILLVAFGQMSIVAPIANIVILPLVPLAMLLTFIAGIGGIILSGFAQVIGFPAQLLLSYMTQTATYFGNLSWAVQTVSLSVVGACLLYVLIALVTYYMWRKTGYNLRNSSLVE